MEKFAEIFLTKFFRISTIWDNQQLKSIWHHQQLIQKQLRYENGSLGFEELGNRKDLDIFCPHKFWH